MRMFCATTMLLGLSFLCFTAQVSESAVSLVPGIYSPEDFTGSPESVSVTSYGVDKQDAATFRKPKTETVNLEVYELKPGLYQFVNDPAAKTDPAAMNADIGGFNVSALAADSGAEGILIRGTGKYPGETVISFGLLSDYKEITKNADGSFNYGKAAAEFGYKFFTGRRYFEVNGTIAVFENVAIGDHASNNSGVIHTVGEGQTFLKDVWIYNVYDGVFFDGNSKGYFVNCIFHQTYMPWNDLAVAQEAGYFTEDWTTSVEPAGLGGTAYAEGVGLSEDTYPQLKGVVLGNDIINGYNINLFQTQEADSQWVYFKNCTLIKHQIRNTNRLWRHNTGSGSGAVALFEDCMIVNVDITSNPDIRIASNDADFLGYLFNTKMWNYASGSVTLNLGGGENWNVNASDPNTFTDANVDITNPGGLDVADASELFQVDGRKLTTFIKGSVELTMAVDGGAVGYRLPSTAPAGALPVKPGSSSAVAGWDIY